MFGPQFPSRIKKTQNPRSTTVVPLGHRLHVCSIQVTLTEMLVEMLVYVINIQNDIQTPIV